MANINDFKLLSKKCLNYFHLAVNTQRFDIKELSEKEKERFGFYYLILSEITHLEDFDRLTSCITDTDFNSKFFNNPIVDEGIDAVFIDDENATIHLFNFKYREKFLADKKQKENEIYLSSKFLNVIKQEKNTLKGKLKKFADDIIQRYNSNTDWTTIFYVVSNENSVVSPKDSNLQNFASLFAVKIEPIGLDWITELLLPSHEIINAKVCLPKEAVISFLETPQSSDVSYIVRMGLPDVIRITCRDKDLRDNYQLEDYDELSSVVENPDVLFGNIRGLLKSTYNKNIQTTLLDQPSKFFYYNNGITIVADDISYKEINGNSRIVLDIKNFQVLNGGQTLRSIHLFNQENEKYISNNLTKAEILVKILKVTDEKLKMEIGEYTNSQNSIKASDLKSVRKEQQELESYLAENNIAYIRKRGDIGENSSSMEYEIGMDRMGQILLATSGYPEAVSNKKREIFTSRYDELFGADSLLSEKTVSLVKIFFTIKEFYKNSDYSYSDQKILYILYLANKFECNNLEKLIDFFEKCILSYMKRNALQLAPSRILILPDFKSYLVSQYSKNR